MSHKKHDKVKESNFLDFLSAYLKPSNWKRTALIIIIVTGVLLLFFALEPIIWNLIFGMTPRITPSERYHSLLSA